MANLKEKAVALLGSVDSVNLNALAQTTIYTVPTGKKCVLDHVRIRNLSANATNTTVTIGQVGALTDFLNTQTLSGLNAAAATGILSPVPNATTVKGIEYTAGEVLQIDVTVVASIACTATIEFFGTIDDA
tara:strand:- start:1713 stop:2105 length:393 start_codon:yes stop_codon:yes gene_type:complete